MKKILAIVFLVLVIYLLVIILIPKMRELFRPSVEENIRSLAYNEALNGMDVPPPSADSSSCLRIRILPDRSIEVLSPGEEKRSEIVLKYLKKLLEKYHDWDIRGVFVIGTGDSYSVPVKGRLVFSKKEGSEEVLIPDLYAMGNYDGDLDSIDQVKFSDKLDRGIFIGASTGSISPPANERLRACYIAHKYPGYFESYLSGNLLQLQEEEVSKYYPDYTSYFMKGMNKEQQYKYRYLINIDGNTCAWNRLPWILNSNSVSIKVESNNICWYYPILKRTRSYVSCESPEDLPNAIKRARKISENERNLMNESGKKFVKEYLNFDTQMLYCAMVLRAKSNDL